MNAHIFVPTAGSKSPCKLCGKTRNTAAHKAGKADSERLLAEAAERQARDFSESYDEADVDSQAETDAILADDEAMAAIAEAESEDIDSHSHTEIEAAASKPAPKRRKPGERSLWVGWRIAEAAMKKGGTLARKLRDAKLTTEYDRTVSLNKAELELLDYAAEQFEKPGRTGPEVYSARSMRRRIKAALESIAAE